MGVYVNRDIDKKLDRIRENVKNEKGKMKMIVEGGEDFNARIGKEGGRVKRGEWKEEGIIRKLKDKKVNMVGRLLL